MYVIRSLGPAWLAAVPIALAPAVASAEEPEARSPLAYLPADTEVVLSGSVMPRILGYFALDLRPEEWVGLKGAADFLGHVFGVTPGLSAGPARVTVGARLAEDLAERLGKKPPAEVGRKDLGKLLRDPVLVLRSGKPVRGPTAEALKLFGVGAEEIRHRDRTYYRGFTAKEDPGPGEKAFIPAGYAVLVADEYTVVCGPEAHVRALIDAGDKVAAPPRLAFIDPTHHTVVALAPHTKGALGLLAPLAGNLAEAAPPGLADAIRRGAVGVSIGCTCPVPADVEARMAKEGLAAADGKEGRDRRAQLLKLSPARAGVAEVRLACSDAAAARELRDALGEAAKRWRPDPRAKTRVEVGRPRILETGPVVSLEAVFTDPAEKPDRPRKP